MYQLNAHHGRLFVARWLDSSWAQGFEDVEGKRSAVCSPAPALTTTADGPHEAGFDDPLLKPIAVEQLEKVLELAVERR